MKKKLYITRAIKLVSFALAVLLTAYLLQAFVLKRNDHNTLRMDGFYVEDKGSLDAVFIGASDIYAGIAAGYAYDKYGITCYPYATQSSPANVILPQIREVIKYQDPKMIVVEINSFMYKDNDLPVEASHRMFIDNVPRDEIWSEYIEENFTEDKRIEFYLPLIKYHGSWSDYPWKIKFLMTDLSLRTRGYSLFRGYKTVANEFHPSGEILNTELANDGSTMPLGYTGERLLRETLEYLRENKITNVVFTRFPHIIRTNAYTRYQRCNEAQRIIESYGYDFINLERYGASEGFVIDKDFYNWDHLNIYGSEKLTDFFCEKLISEYGVTPSELNAEQKAGWDDSVRYYYMIKYYAEEQIKQRLEVKNPKDKAITISEDDESIGKIEEYARQTHPELLK